MEPLVIKSEDSGGYIENKTYVPNRIDGMYIKAAMIVGPLSAEV